VLFVPFVANLFVSLWLFGNPWNAWNVWISCGGIVLSYRSLQSVFFIILSGAVLFVSPLQGQTDSADQNSPENSKTDKRLFKVLPNYRTVNGSIPFVPLSARQKLSIASHDSFDWPTYVIAVPLTFATPGGKSDTASYGKGLKGFANRYIRSSADQISGNLMTEGFLPVLLHEDPRYFRLGDGTTRHRLVSALSQIAVVRTDSGHRTFNASEFFGNAVATGISNAYSPNLNSWPHRGEKLLLMISTDTFSNVVKEFGPDIRQLLHRHKSS